MKSCETHTVIHLRNDTEDIRWKYCVEVTCSVHESNWVALCATIEQAAKLTDAFPLVHGGLVSGKDALPCPKECILSGIPRFPAPPALSR